MTSKKKVYERKQQPLSVGQWAQHTQSSNKLGSKTVRPTIDQGLCPTS